MSITDELRKVAAKTECANGRCEKLYRGDLDHIADRIDQEHEECEGFARRLEDAASKGEEVTIFGTDYIQLPKDADGETIHIGDYLHSDENGKDFPCRGFELTLMQGVKWWTVECCYDSYSGTSEHVSAKSCHHVKPDSWERIIEDAQADGVRYHNEGKPSDFDALVERCKRLAGENA